MPVWVFERYTETAKPQLFIRGPSMIHRFMVIVKRRPENNGNT